MSYNDYFQTINKRGRVNPAQTSGRSLTSEVRQRVEGDSLCAVYIGQYDRDSDIIRMEPVTGGPALEGDTDILRTQCTFCEAEEGHVIVEVEYQNAEGKGVMVRIPDGTGVRVNVYTRR